MILHVYVLKNRLSGIYERPFAELYDSVEYPEALASSLALASPAELNRHKEYDLYILGEFDSKTGQLSNCRNEFICSLEQVCIQYLKVKEAENHVREKSN